MDEGLAQRSAHRAQGEAAPSAVDVNVEGVRHSFDGRRVVLDGVSFRVPRGQTVALIGANGAGKSTLLGCCVRLVRPTAGSVRVLGENVPALGSGALRRLRARVGFVFQRHNLVPRLSVLSNVIHGAQGRYAGPIAWYQGLAPRALREEALHRLEQVGVADAALQRADRLSGGQSQRVAIARALMQRPAMILADEPVASLDPAAGRVVMALFLELVRREGLTLVFTSHDLDGALRHSDRVLGLRGGQLELDAPPRSCDPARLKALYE